MHRVLFQAEKVEETSRHGVLGRQKNCSTERIEVLSNKIERNRPLRYTPSSKVVVMETEEFFQRESIRVTSTSSKDFFSR